MDVRGRSRTTADCSRSRNIHEGSQLQNDYSYLGHGRVPSPHRLRRTLAGTVAVLAMAAGVPQASLGHTCGSNWCSGSDSETAHNIQGHGPQVYIGEVDSYQHNFYGVAGPCPGGPDDDMCWSFTGANNAVNRHNSGGGIGVEDYYFGGGAGANNQGVSSYCWGAKQGYHDTYDMAVFLKSYVPYEYLGFIDIEDPTADYGWFSTEQFANRQVFNGFSDYLAGRNPCGYGVNSGDVSQYGVYSSPNAWSNEAMGSSGYVPRTYIWTYERCCQSAWPGLNWGARAQWFGSSNYDWALQFTQSPDYNDAHEPNYLPVFGYTIGN